LFSCSVTMFTSEYFCCQNSIMSALPLLLSITHSQIKPTSASVSE